MSLRRSLAVVALFVTVLVSLLVVTSPASAADSLPSQPSFGVGQF